MPVDIHNIVTVTQTIQMIVDQTALATRQQISACPVRQPLAVQNTRHAASFEMVIAHKTLYAVRAPQVHIAQAFVSQVD
jgi:hypothetical protein